MRYAKEFKQQVKESLLNGMTIQEAVKEYSMNESTLRIWKKEYTDSNAIINKYNLRFKHLLDLVRSRRE